jgi:DNA-directed RNA polymerase specialized sigma24 family protein
MARDVVSAIALLPDAYRHALHLRLGGASSDEIAAALRLEPSAVEPLLVVADAKLRALMLDDELSAPTRATAG